ncbi:hypothetical protein [Heyndrickxia ginsengihumi]|uniref:Uncharacterized protein n=1 Tax=Heyndrickxia ginsengihumi TaxID=363870 RepID=A0A0A6VCL9_9BACI|nr:hypothetical protein [Heyndrickxia ginsengihumi]KHD85301.1 hypothetical protein NG54_10255 [Heyndrickxia ginsengihumi]MBE6185339.1 hypothetical protein [Bacillus sp. (in: firmicutes)]MCM3023750.1 hypothetical protein [Heyndrickxia ginsengihumi]NEY19357.1 hypothetical protein [Heyndrickxia ginsengihumi]
MSEGKREKVIHVDKLVIHAQEVEIINEGNNNDDNEQPRRDPWDFFWRPQQRQLDEVSESSNNENVEPE